MDNIQQNSPQFKFGDSIFQELVFLFSFSFLGVLRCIDEFTMPDDYYEILGIHIILGDEGVLYGKPPKEKLRLSDNFTNPSDTSY